jgi:hypothetical protein
MTRELVEQGQQSGEIRADIDADLIARLLMTSVFYYFMRAHPLPPHSADSDRDGALPPERTPLNSSDPERSPQYVLDLEAKLIESVDNLLDGLGGPNWRQQ